MHKLVSEFQLLAIEHWENLYGGKNVRKANRCFDKQYNVFEEIKKANLLPELRLLLDDPRDEVVSDVAGIFLNNKIYVEDATKAFERLSHLNGALGFNAEMCLKYIL